VLSIGFNHRCDAIVALGAGDQLEPAVLPFLNSRTGAALGEVAAIVREDRK